MTFSSDKYKEYATYHLPLRKDTKLDGIIKKSQEKGYSISISSSSEAVTPDGNLVYRAKYIIDYTQQGEYYWHSVENQTFGEYVQIEFENQWIRPSGYVFVDSGNPYKSRNWDLLGSSDGINFVKLDSHSNVPIFTEDRLEKYFKIKKRQRAFRYIKLVQTGKNYCGAAESCAFRLGKLEIFGDTLVCNETYSKCKTSIPLFPQECSLKLHRKSNHMILFIILILC